MFVLTTVADTIRIPPQMFVHTTLTGVHSEIEAKYPNRVIMDVGLVICRYGDALEVGDGVLVAGDGAAHHEVVFRLIIFRPFVEEVLVGTVKESTEEGIHVSLGFFENIFIPGARMQRPSHFDNESGLWVWTPSFGDGDNDDAAGDGEEEHFELEIGAKIRFKVKAINFTRVTNTVKGVQATTTTTAHSTNPASVERTLSGTNSSSTADARGYWHACPEAVAVRRSERCDEDSCKYAHYWLNLRRWAWVALLVECGRGRRGRRGGS